MEADLIVHVRDVAHAESERQAADVMAILAEIAPGQPIAENPLEALNKLDLVDGDARDRLHNLTARQAHAVPISALSGEGCEQLLAEIDERLSAGNEVLDVRIALADGAAIAWLYANGEVTKRRDADGFANIRGGPDSRQRRSPPPPHQRPRLARLIDCLADYAHAPSRGRGSSAARHSVDKGG